MAEENSKEFQEAIRANSEQLKAFADAINTATRESGPKAEADKLAAAKAREAADALKTLNQQLRTSAFDFGKSLLTGGEGLGKFSGAVTGAADGIGSFVGRLGPLGFVVGGLIKIFGQLAGASLKQNDAIMKSYRELAEAGSISGSLEKLKDDLGRVGLTSEETEKFSNMLKKVAPELSAFGGSVSIGKEKLLGVIQGMIGPRNEIERSMARLGYGAEEMRDATADYIAKQTRLGLVQGKTQAELRDGAVKYMTTMRELQELTGLQRDQAQKIMDQQMADYRYSSYLRELEMSGKKDEANNLRTYMAGYQAMFGEQRARDLMEQIAARGAAFSEASIRAQMSTQGEAYRAAMLAQTKQITMFQGIDMTVKGMRRNMDALGPSYTYLGQSMNQLVGSEEGLIAMNMLEGKTQVEQEKIIKEQMRKQKDRLDQNTIIEQRGRALRVAADRGLWEVGSATVSILEKLNKALMTFGKFIAKLIDKIGPSIGLDATNLAASFRDLSDVAGDIADSQRERNSLLAEQTRLQQELLIGQDQQRDYQAERVRAQRELDALNQERINLTTSKNTAAKIANYEAIIAKKEELKVLTKQQQTQRELKDDKAVSQKEARLEEIRKRLLEEDAKQKKLQREKQTLKDTTGSSNDNDIDYTREIQEGTERVSELQRTLVQEEYAQRLEKQKSIIDKKTRESKAESIQKEITDLRDQLSKTTDKEKKLELQQKITVKQNELVDFNRKTSEAEAATTKSILAREQRLLNIQEDLVKEETSIRELEKEQAERFEQPFDKKRPAPNTVTGRAIDKIDTSARDISAVTGEKVDAKVVARRNEAAAGLTKSGTGRAEEILNKLNFKNKGENIGGGNVDPSALALAEKISESMPNSIFTALNDKFHQKNYPNSKHTKGKAIDFAMNPPPKDAEEAAVIKERIKDMGASKVLDEYFADRNQYTTGGHFHVEVARQGGIFSGPEAGYPVMLHGNEAVVPMPNLDTFVSDVKKQSLSSIKDTSPPSAANNVVNNSSTAGLEMLSEILTTKFEDMIDQLESANDTLKNLLTYAKA